jgi:hypothetical protein
LPLGSLTSGHFSPCCFSLFGIHAGDFRLLLLLSLIVIALPLSSGGRCLLLLQYVLLLLILLLLGRRGRCLLLLNDAASNNPTQNSKTDPETVTRVGRRGRPEHGDQSKCANSSFKHWNSPSKRVGFDKGRIAPDGHA